MSERRRSWIKRWKHYFRHTRKLLGPAPKRTSLKQMREARSILLEKRDNIGDFVLATAFFNEVYRRWSDRDVTLVCTPGIAPLARLLYPEWEILPMTVAAEADHFVGSWEKPSALQRWVRELPRADLLINLRSIRHQNEMTISSWMPAESKLAVRNQFHYEEGEYIKISDRRVFSRTLSAAQQTSPDVCRDIANHRILLGGLFPELECSSVWPGLDLGGQGRECAQRACAKGALSSDMLLLVPFPSGAIRSYPLDRLAEIASRLAHQYGLSIGVLGGEKDREATALLMPSLSAPKGVKSLAGVLSLPELIEAVRGCRLMLGVDTGPVHIAIACHVPTVVVLGGGHYGTFGPWGDLRLTRWITHTMPCFDCNWVCCHGEAHCIRRVDPAAIYQAAEAVLAGAAAKI